MKHPELLERALAAHGGLDRWAAYRQLGARMHYGGLAPEQWLTQWPLRDVRIELSTRVPRVMICPYPQLGMRGLYASDDVMIASDAGPICAEKLHARDRLARRRPFWDRLDMLFYISYAFWNYLSVPFLLAREGFEFEALPPWEADGAIWQRLKVRFPDWLPTHSQEQVFYFDERGLLRRHDFVPESIGRFLVARTCEDYREVGGLMLPTRMRAYLRNQENRVLRLPPVAWARLEQLSLT